MQKKLIALAVAGALVAPLAAQAEVTVYGIAHVDVRNSDNGADSWTNVNSNSSRVGVKGAEELSDGLKAVFQMEFGVDMADNTGSGGSANNITARNQFVGLAGGFGTVLVGRHDTPYKLAVANLDVFADTIADYNNVIGVHGALDTRENNVIAYATPEMGGLSALLAYVPDENPTDLNVVGGDRDTSKYSANVKYAGGPLFAGLGYIQANEADTDLGQSDVTGIRAGLGYSVAGLSAGFVYETTTFDRVAPGVADFDIENMYLSAAYAIGDNTLKAAYGQMAGDLDDVDAGATWYGVGVSHTFSKATQAYVVYSSMNNDTLADWSLGATGPGNPVGAAGLGEDPSALAIGMVHKF